MSIHRPPRRGAAPATGLAFMILMTVIGSSGRATAQPKHGDLVLSVGVLNPPSGTTFYVDPGRPGTLTTLAVAPAKHGHAWVRMAPDNRSVVVSEAAGWTTGRLIELAGGGVRTTIVTGIHLADGFALDHDDHWVASCRDFASAPKKNFLLRISHAKGSVTTLASFPSPTVTFNEMAIDRDPGASAYVVACHESSTTLAAPKILGVGEQGRISTLAGGIGGPLLGLTCIELHPRSGDYLVTGSVSPEVKLVGKTGIPQAVTALGGPNAARITQDDTLWVVRNGPPFWVLRYDLSTKTVVTMFKLGLPAGDWITGLEVFGSRPLVCNQSTPSAVAVNVQSRHVFAGGARYALAASLARRPGVKLANGEWLDLDVSHPLFYLSALGVWPAVFQDFQGTLDPFGNATAKVNIPTSLPKNLGITIFVAGVIFSPKQGVIQVTNTHWFVL